MPTVSAFSVQSPISSKSSDSRIHVGSNKYKGKNKENLKTNLCGSKRYKGSNKSMDRENSKRQKLCATPAQKEVSKEI